MVILRPLGYLRRLCRTGGGAVGLLLIVFVVLIAVAGPLAAPHDPNQPIGLPGAPPSSGALLGTDVIGRDVLSRVLYGGRSLLGLAIAATVVSYLLGTFFGLLAGYMRSVADAVIVRFVDFMWAFPNLLLILLLVAAFGPSASVLLVGVIIASQAGIIRLVRAATLEVSTRGHVEAAVARGDRTRAIIAHEVFPNIVPTILPDFTIRLSFAVFIIAGFNYLGLGLQPPTSDWAVMTSENRDVISSNPLSVFAPAVMIACLAIGVNLLGDAIARTLGQRDPTLDRP